MSEKDGNTFSETFTVATENLADKIKELVEQGNARRVIVRNKKGKELVNVPLTGSAIAGGAFVLAAPLVSAIGVIAALPHPCRWKLFATSRQRHREPPKRPLRSS